MTSIFFPFSAGCTLLRRVYCLPSTRSAALALENASTRSAPKTTMVNLFIAAPAKGGGYSTPIGPCPPTQSSRLRQNSSHWTLRILDHRDVEPALAEISLDAIELVGIVVRP